MKDDEIFKRLEEFAVYLAKQNPSKEKRKLGKFFTGYRECFKEFTNYKYLYEEYRK